MTAIVWYILAGTIALAVLGILLVALLPTGSLPPIRENELSSRNGILSNLIGGFLG